MDLEIAIVPARQPMLCNVIGPDGVATPPPPPGFDVDAQAYFDRVASVATFSSAFRAAVNNLVVNLKSDGIWGLLTVLYLMNVEIAGQEAFNVVANSFKLTKSGTLSLTPKSNIISDGSTGFYDTTVKIDNTSKLNMSMGAFVVINASGPFSIFGDAVVNNDVTLIPSNGGSGIGRIGNNATPQFPGTLTAQHLSVERNGANQSIYKDGVNVSTTTVTDLSVSSSDILIFRRLTTFSPLGLGCVWIGAAMGDALQAAMSSRLTSFIASVT